AWQSSPAHALSVRNCILPILSFSAPPRPASYTLSLHDALPICDRGRAEPRRADRQRQPVELLRRQGELRRRHRLLALGRAVRPRDRKSTCLNSSHLVISYAVFCLKKKRIHRHGPPLPQPQPWSS